MITINDTDLPITAAEKLIKGTREEVSHFQKALAEAMGTEPGADRYDVDELKEIADYLLTYCKHHETD